MILHVINTGSVGNCYLLESENSVLMIEAGSPFKWAKAALNFDLSKVAGCLLTHEHLDHSKSIYQVMQAGINVYSSHGTFSKVGGIPHRMKYVSSMDKFIVGEFEIIAFKVMHDAAEPLGFLIKHPECGNVLFVTDSYYVPFTFKGLNNIIVEANYCEEIVNGRLAHSSIHKAVRDRVLQSHMSVQTCAAMLRANDLSKVNNIVLIHLSDGNSYEKGFKETITKATGKNVTVASKGMKIELNKTAI